MTPTRKMFTGALALACLPLLGAGIVASSTRATTADGWFAHAYPDAATYFYAQAVAAKVTLSNAVDRRRQGGVDRVAGCLLYGFRIRLR